MIIRVITRRREPSRTETTKILTDVPHNNYADVEKVRPSIRRQEPFLLLILSAFESHASNSSVWAFAPSSVSDQVFLCVENLHHSLRPRELMKSSYFFPTVTAPTQSTLTTPTVFLICFHSWVHFGFLLAFYSEQSFRELTACPVKWIRHFTNTITIISRTCPFWQEGHPGLRTFS